MNLCMLIENNTLSQSLKKEHGLSLYIETMNRKILFDTGASGDFIDNAARLGINIEDIDSVIISHAHKDHSGGLIRFLEVNSKAKVYMSRKNVHEYYAKLFVFKKNISMPKEVFKTYKNRIHFVDEFTDLGKDAFIISKFARKYPLLKSNKHLLVKVNQKLISDNFEHELVLVINNGGKLIIFSGCSHNGIENMIETVFEYFPNAPVQAVIGGLHLMDFPRNVLQESHKDITAMGNRLMDYNIEKIYTCHCTGQRAFNILKQLMGHKIENFKTGMKIKL
jgi:7,8-dihydropterin-6-yl-methyl-4-(beta-D-ribofuranosyl)aminobenzene 5'-phosphate synthase